MVGTLVSVTLAAYAFARLRFQCASRCSTCAWVS